MINHVTLIGNLGGDPEVKATGSGTIVGRLSLATNESVKRGDKWEDHTEWHRVVCFEKNAENAGRFLKKGSRIHVFGRLRTTKWKDKDGIERWTTEIIADRITFLDRAAKHDGPPVDSYEAGGGGGGSAGGSAGGGNPSGGYDFDEIPF